MNTLRVWPKARGTPTASSVWWWAPRARKKLSACAAVAPTLPLLIPGVGAQGGDAVATVRAAQGGPMVINSSRADSCTPDRDADFASAARAAAIATRSLLNDAALAR